MTSPVAGPRPQGLGRFVTRVPGLDQVLRGGLVAGGIYLIGGTPGAGKTTLASHIAFEHARQGGSATIATLLSESHSRMLAHLKGFAFFSPELVSDRVQYLSIYDELARSGLEGSLTMLRRHVREHRTTFLAIDGAGIFGDFAPNALGYRRFAYELHAQLAALACTAVLLADLDEDVHTIGTHVDGIIALRDESVGVRDVRLLHVKKLRGVDYLRGRHQFAITPNGIEVFPRLESIAPAVPDGSPGRAGRAAFGVQGLDDMLQGGVQRASVTTTLGSPGAGKTISGLHFIHEGARRGERGLILSFHEPPARLLGKAKAIGLDLDAAVREGTVRIIWHPPLETLLDEWAQRTLRLLEEHRAERLFIDGVSDVQRLVPSTDRLPPFFAAFANELRSRNVTTLLAAEQTEIVGEIADSGALAGIVDNVILLRYVELRSHLHRLLSILKVRESDYDSSIREFRICGTGIEVADTFQSAEAVLTGIARLAPMPSRAAE